MNRRAVCLATYALPLTLISIASCTPYYRLSPESGTLVLQSKQSTSSSSSHQFLHREKLFSPSASSSELVAQFPIDLLARKEGGFPLTNVEYRYRPEPLWTILKIAAYSASFVGLWVAGTMAASALNESYLSTAGYFAGAALGGVVLTTMPDLIEFEVQGNVSQETRDGTLSQEVPDEDAAAQQPVDRNGAEP